MILSHSSLLVHSLFFPIVLLLSLEFQFGSFNKSSISFLIRLVLSSTFLNIENTVLIAAFTFSTNSKLYYCSFCFLKLFLHQIMSCIFLFLCILSVVFHLMADIANDALGYWMFLYSLNILELCSGIYLNYLEIDSSEVCFVRQIQNFL